MADAPEEPEPQTPPAAAGTVPASTQATPATTLVDLPHGRGLSLAEASSIARQAPTSVVLFAGTEGSGKTTLLATLYLLFQKGPFAGYSFASSATLVGFEERNYFARVASTRSTPTTERTKVSELLHLGLRRLEPLEPRREVLLCDFSGEDFREAKDSSDACRSLHVLHRTNHLVLLVDGKKLVAPDARRRAMHDPTTLLRNCLDTGVVGRGVPVDLLFTKWDLVEASAQRAEIMHFVEHAEAQIRRQFNPHLASLRLARVAAHPTDTTLELGYGLEALFPAWVESREGCSSAPPRPLTEPAKLTEYDRFLRRRLPSRFAHGS